MAPPSPAPDSNDVGVRFDRTTNTLVIADGFSCRTQIEQGGTGRRPVHPVHLAEALRFAPPAPPAVAEQRNGYRTAAAAAAAGVLATAGAAWAARKTTRGAR